MAYTRPGVYVTESPLKTLVRTNEGTATAAFVGINTRGPVDPTMISSWSSYTSQFGDLNPSFDLGYAVYQFFANGGRNCYVSRAVYANATASTAGSVMYYTPATGGASAALFGATALDPGTYGNNITLTTTAGLIGLDVASSTFPTFNLTVKLNASEVESWTELSPDPANNRYAPTIVNNYSSYVNITSFASQTAAASAGFVYTHATNQALTGGSVGSPAVAAPADWDTPFSTALNKLIDLPEPLLINAVGQSRDVIVKAALAVAANRGDSFVIIDPNTTLTTQSAISSAVAGYNTDKGYGAVYYPMLTMADPTKTGVGAVRSTFPGGAVAGMFARTEVERTVAKAPAGYSLEVRNALGLVTSFTESDIGLLYDAGVNTFKAVPGAGIIIQGARTLNLIKPDKYIPVRRTLNYVKNGSKELTKFAIFEPNDSRLWSNISTQLNKFLTTLWGAGGLKGRTPGEAFYVVCDSTNNTQTSIDNGQVNIQIGVSLLYPAEFIVINVSQWLGGNNTTENI